MQETQMIEQVPDESQDIKKQELRNKLIELIKSRKFWAALVGLVLLTVKAFDDKFPLDEEQTTNMVYILVAYILGTALENPSWLLKK